MVPPNLFWEDEDFSLQAITAKISERHLEKDVYSVYNFLFRSLRNDVFPSVNKVSITWETTERKNDGTMTEGMFERVIFFFCNFAEDLQG